MDVEDWFDDIVKPTRRNTYFPSSHNTSPITLFPQSLMIDYFMTKNKELLSAKPVRNGVELIETAKGRIGGRNLQITDDASPIYSEFFSLGLQTSTKLSNSELNKLTMLLESTFLTLNREIIAIEHHHPSMIGILSSFLLASQENNLLLAVISSTWQVKEFLELVRNKVQQIHVTQESSDKARQLDQKWKHLRVIANDSLIIFTTTNFPNTMFLLNYDQLTMLADTMISRFCTTFACQLQYYSENQFLPTVTELIKIYRWGDKLIEKYGFDAYAAIGEFESVITHCLITFEGSDILGLSDIFLNGIKQNEQEMKDAYKIDPGWVEELLEITYDLGSVNKMSEVFGLRKHWGNPVLDAQSSGEYVQLKAMEQYPVDEDALITILAAFQRMITLQFIKSHGCWPVVEFEKEYSGTPLAVAYKEKNTHINEFSAHHEYLHWAHFRFKKNVKIDLDMDSLSLLSDKACSLYQKNLDHAFLYAYRSDPNKKTSPNPVESRRILLEYLRRDHYSIKDIFKIVMTDSIPDEWYVNLCSLKGTEMKHQNGRIFAVLCYELRQYFTATEEIIKDHLFPYNPYQTMTMKERELLETLDKITTQLNPDVESEYLYILHIIDFSKWNLRMAYENTCLVFKSMDDFLGTPNLIEATHPIFTKLTNVLQDPFRPPKNGVAVSESETIWRGHRRGWEGQRQKGWTMLTSALLAYLEHETGVSSQIIGQGDNQVLCSKFKIPSMYANPREWIKAEGTEVRKQVDTFYESLIRECLKIGLPVKKSESCRSFNYCNYTKRLSFTGVDLSMELKRISRIATEANMSYPTTDNLCTTLTGAAAATPIFGPPSLISTYVNYFILASILYRSFRNNPLIDNLYYNNEIAAKGRRITSEFLSNIMAIPSSLGGPSRTTFTSSMFRGHPDPIASDFAIICMCAKSGSTFHKKLLAILLSGALYNDTKILLSDEKEDVKYFAMDDKYQSLVRLIKSPYSLNCKRPPLVQRPLLRFISQAIHQSCYNSEIKPLFANDLDEQDRSLQLALSSMKPFLPTIANDIYSRSLPGRKDTFLNGFQNTTSFSRLLIDANVDPITLIKRSEYKFLESLDKLVLEISNTIYASNMVIPQHHDLLQQVREESWGIKIEGVTVPHPVEALALVDAPFDVCNETCRSVSSNGDFLLLALTEDERVMLPGQFSETRLLQRVKRKMGFTGNVQEEGITGKTMRSITHSSPLNDAIRLNILRKWAAGLEGNLADLLQKIIESRTDISLSTLDCLTGASTRLSYTHRAAVMSSQRSCSPSCLTNFHTQIYLSSNRFSALNEAENNKAFVFSQAYLLYQHLIGLMLYHSPEKFRGDKVIFHAHNCLQHLHDVYDGRVTLLTSKIATTKLPKECRSLYAKQEKTLLEFTGSVTKKGVWQSLQQTSLRVSRMAYGVQSLGNIFSREARLRALMNTENVQIHKPRGCSIAAGDISLIGVDAYLDSIAMSLLLLMPFSISSGCLRNKQGPIIDSFLHCIGSRAWSSICGPLLIPRLLRPLCILGFDLRTNNMGQSLEHVILLVQKLVARKMTSLLNDLKTSVCHRKAESPIIIFSDGQDSSIFLFTRYVELMFSVLANLIHDSRINFLRSARDVINTIHDLKDTSGMETILDYTSEAFVLVQNPCPQDHIPLIFVRPKFIDINQDWASKLSQYDKQDHQPCISLIGPAPKLSMIKNPASRTEILTSPNILISFELLVCNCVTRRERTGLQTHRFHQPSGITSKDHYPIIEALSLINLPLCNVIILGSSSGSEAASLARLEDVHKIYNNPLINTKTFSHHSAGTYMPSEFLGDQFYADKLHLSDRTVIGYSSSHNNGLRDVVMFHTEGISWSGLILNRMSHEKYDDNWCDIIEETKQVIQIALNRIERPGWVMTVSRYKCIHELTAAASIFSLVFHNIYVINSAYVSYNAGPLIIVGVKLKQSQYWRIQNIPGGYFNTFVEDEALRLNALFKDNDNRHHPRILATNRAQRRSYTNVSSFLPSGLISAQQSYLPGLHVDFKLDSKEDIVNALDQYILACETGQTLSESAFDQLESSRRMTVSQLLSVNEAGLQYHLYQIGVLMLKATILKHVLLRPVISADHVCETIFYALTNKNHKRIMNHVVHLGYSLSQFCYYDSGDLFEIIGHVNKATVHFPILTPLPKNLHFSVSPTIISARNPFQLTVAPYRAKAGFREDSQWKWPLRSQLCFVLFCRYLYPNQNIIMLGEQNGNVKGFASSRLKFTSVRCLGDLITLDHNSIFACYTDEDLNELLTEEVYKTCIIIGRVTHSKLNEMQKTPCLSNSIWSTRPIWEGVCPRIAWVIIGQNILDHKTQELNTNDWSSTACLWLPKHKLSRCQCRDCSGEQFLLDELDIHSSEELDDLASSQSYMESVFDIIH